MAGPCSQQLFFLLQHPRRWATKSNQGFEKRQERDNVDGRRIINSLVQSHVPKLKRLAHGRLTGSCICSPRIGMKADDNSCLLRIYFTLYMNTENQTRVWNPFLSQRQHFVIYRCPNASFFEMCHRIQLVLLLGIVPTQLACVWFEDARNPCHFFASISFSMQGSAFHQYTLDGLQIPSRLQPSKSTSVRPDANYKRSFRNQDSLEYQSIGISHSSII